MLAAQYKEFSADLNNIKLVEVDKPIARSGYVVVKVFSASVNPIDYMCMQGMLQGAWRFEFPITLGYDLAGKVDSIAPEDEAKFKVGDDVFAVNWGDHAHANDGDPIAGAFANYALIPVQKLSRIPNNVTYDQAAAVALVGTTAYQAIFDIGELESGKKALILGGPTAVGAYAIQLLKLKNIFVACTTSTRNMEYTKSLQPDLIIDYRVEKWYEREDLKDFDVIFDIVGEPDAIDNARNNKVIKEDGKFITITNPTVGYDPTAYPPLTYGGFYCLKNDTKVQDELINLVADKKLQVRIDSTFSFTSDGLMKLFEKLKSGTTVGKNMLKMIES